MSECNSSLIARLRKQQHEDSELKKILESEVTDGYIIRAGLIYKEVDEELRVVVPSDMQAQIIRRAHEIGHFSVDKTERLVKRDYWFREMWPKVEKVVHTCISCILAEKKHGKQEGFLNPISKGEAPLDTSKESRNQGRKVHIPH